MAVTPSVDVDAMRAWIGREETVSDVVSEDLARKVAATFGTSVSGVRESGILPPLAHFCLGQTAVTTGLLGSDGHPQKGGFLPDVPLPRRMWAGGQVTFHADLRVGDGVTRTSKIADLQYKHGRSGALVFVTVEHSIRAGAGTVVEETQDIVFREAAAPNTPAPTAAAAPEGRHREQIDVSSILLFRYSALTFNSHRIHYDRRYAMAEEGYPGLVVHGPLQATLLAIFAETLGNARLKSFSFRSQSALYDLDPLVMHASEDETGLSLWTAHPGGPIAMSAKAVFA